MDKLKKILKDLISNREGLVSAGNCKDYAEYREAIGNISGLKSAVRELEDLQDKRKHTDD